MEVNITLPHETSYGKRVGFILVVLPILTTCASEIASAYETNSIRGQE